MWYLDIFTYSFIVSLVIMATRNRKKLSKKNILTAMYVKNPQKMQS